MKRLTLKRQLPAPDTRKVLAKKRFVAATHITLRIWAAAPHRFLAQAFASLGRGQLPFQGLLRMSMLALGVAVAGCTSEKSREAALAHMGDEAPPDFLVGPTAIALTNFDGFSATVAATSSADAVARTYSGQILEREGRLLFQPMTTAKTKKGKIVRGGMIFIWEPMLNRGEVVSEALQGYAPLAPAARITSVAPASTVGVPEPMNGHPCHRVESKVSLSDGSTAKVTEWRADDLGHVPVRVRSEQSGQLVTMDLTDIRLDLPSPELFVPPSEFTRYDSSLALINELLIRESPLKGGPTSGPALNPDNPRATSGVGRSY